MKRLFYKWIFVVFAPCVLVSCSKDKDISVPGSPSLKIVKRIVASPTDFVSYEYNAKGNVTRYVSQWQSGSGAVSRLTNTFEYDVNDQITKWSNEAGYGIYTYNNGRLQKSDHFAANGKKISEIFYTFGSGNRLTGVLEKTANPLPDDIKETKVGYQYDNYGNISRIDISHRKEVTDDFQLSLSTLYVEYDKKKNPEPDGVTGMLLPGVILQKNNPVKVQNVSADGTLLGYSRYEYAYNASGFPTEKKHYLASEGIEQPPVLFQYEY